MNEQKKRQLGIAPVLSEEDIAKLKNLAKNDRRSVSQYVAIIIEQYLNSKNT